MHVVRVIEAKRYRHLPTGRTASTRGACPWTSEAERAQWVCETVGWTWERSDGTVGLGRRPAETRAEAEAVMAAINARRAD